MNKVNIKIFVAGLLCGGIIVGGGLWVIQKKNNDSKLFANKERCASYTQKRQAEANEKANLLGHSTTVQGFYSSVANTCITNIQEIATGHYIQRTLIDELTGKTEAVVFEAMGADFTTLPLETKQEQVQQDIIFGERLKYFQGE